MIFINQLAGIRRAINPVNLKVIRHVHKSDTFNSTFRFYKYMKYTTIATGVIVACSCLYIHKTIGEVKEYIDELILENERLKIANAKLKRRLAEQQKN